MVHVAMNARIFSKFIHEACWYINFHAKLRNGSELVKIYEEAIANQE